MPMGMSVSSRLSARAGGERIETGEAQAAWSSLRSGEKSLYSDYWKRDAKSYQAKRRKWKKAAHLSERRESSSCYNKRHALKKIKARLRGGYKPTQGDELRRRRDYLQGYLGRFCS